MKLEATSLKKFATFGLTLLSFQVSALASEKLTSLDRIEVRLVDGAIYSTCDVRRTADCKTSAGAFVTDDLVTSTQYGKLRMQAVPAKKKSLESRINEIDSMLASDASGALVRSVQDLLNEKNARQNAILDLDKGVWGENYFLTGAILTKEAAGKYDDGFQSVDFLGYGLMHKEGESIRVIYEPQMKMNFIIERYSGEVARNEGKLLERILVKCEQREMVNSYKIASMKLSFEATPELECTTGGNGRLRFEIRAK